MMDSATELTPLRTLFCSICSAKSRALVMALSPIVNPGCGDSINSLHHCQTFDIPDWNVKVMMDH
jgi:hypothetical protein